MRGKGVLAAGATLLLLGCGVPKNQHQEQVMRSQELAARNADLEARLERAAQLAEGLREEGEACRSASRELDAQHQRSLARLGDLQQQLEGALAREEGLRADLDLCRRALGAEQVDLLTLQREHDEQRQGWIQRQAKLQGELEAARGEAADLRAEVLLLQQEQARIEAEKREQLDEVSSTYEGLLTGLRDEVEQGRVTISKLRGQLSVNLLDEILFDSGSSVVKPEGQELLLRLGELLGEMKDKRVLIEGHTDNIPIRGELAKRFATNWELSAARAVSVVRYLEEVVGLDPQRLVAQGFGEHRPAAGNDSPEQRALNRRIEVKLMPLRQPVPAAAEPAQEEPAPSLDTEGGSGEGR